MNQSNKKISLSALLTEELAGMRLDQALAKLFPEYSRSRIQQWIQNQQVWVDGQLLRSKDKIKTQQRVEISADIPIVADWQGQDMAIPILYADDYIFVINKPAGIVVHPAAGNPDRTVVNAMLHLDPELALLPRAGIVHRLDKNTSGVMVIARNLIAHHSLVSQIHNRQVKREYLAIANGLLTGGGTVNAPIGRHPSARTRMAVVDSGKLAITHYRLLKHLFNYTYLKVTLETGRTHQIRVHMAHIGHPLLGDPVYGGRLKIPPACPDELKSVLTAFKRQCLHAHRLTLTHPQTGEVMSWEAPLADDFQHLLDILNTVVDD